MNAQALLKRIFWPDEEPAQEQDEKTFPPEAYSYDDPIDKEVIAAIQKEADKKLQQQTWTTIERLEDRAAFK